MPKVSLYRWKVLRRSAPVNRNAKSSRLKLRLQNHTLEVTHKCIIPGCEKEVPPDGPTCCKEHDPKAWEAYEGCTKRS